MKYEISTNQIKSVFAYMYVVCILIYNFHAEHENCKLKIRMQKKITLINCVMENKKKKF